MENSERDGSTRPPDLPPEKSVRRLRRSRPVAGQEATVRTLYKQMTGSKLGKEYDKAVYCYPVYLTYMQSTS